MSDSAIAVIAAVAAVLVIFLIAEAVLFKKCICRGPTGDVIAFSDDIYAKYLPEMQAGADWFVAQGPESVAVTSYDGLRLAALLLTVPDARGTFILMHGYHGAGLRDFGCVLRYYSGHGYNILLPDQRASGKSEGKYITFGIRERFDCKTWVEFANARFGALPVYLDGISMGCTTVLMATGLELPENVRAVVADCGFTSPREIMKSVLNHGLHLPAFPLLYMTQLAARLFAGFRLDEYSTLTAMRQNKIPVFFAHGGSDAFVPMRMTLENHAACRSRKHLLIADSAGHGLSYLTDKARYEAELEQFLDSLE